MNKEKRREKERKKERKTSIRIDLGMKVFLNVKRKKKYIHPSRSKINWGQFFKYINMN